MLCSKRLKVLAVHGGTTIIRERLSTSNLTPTATLSFLSILGRTLTGYLLTYPIFNLKIRIKKIITLNKHDQPR